MKHNLTVTIILLMFFIVSQLLGLSLINADSNITTTQEGNETTRSVAHGDTSVGSRPETKGFGSYLYLVIGVAIGTILVLLLVRFHKSTLWKAWFFLAVWIALSIALGVIIKKSIFFSYDLSIAIALILSVWKIFKPNVIIHNVTEVLMYAGIAVLLVPLFDVFWAIILLVTISLYDMYAVWKSKHMVKMAKFQTKSQIFSGLMIPYHASNTSDKQRGKAGRTSNEGRKGRKSKIAILGGGDVAFPLIFAGVVMEQLIIDGLTKWSAFAASSIIVVTTTVALALLFFFAKKDRFYPAMPFISAGCFVGWGIVLLI